MSNTRMNLIKALQAKSAELDSKVADMNGKAMVRCPKCQSRNFAVINKQINKPAFLLAGPVFGVSNKAQAVCTDCGKRWTI